MFVWSKLGYSVYYLYFIKRNVYITSSTSKNNSVWSLVNFFIYDLKLCGLTDNLLNYYSVNVL